MNKLLENMARKKYFSKATAIILAILERDGTSGISGQPHVRAGPRDHRNRPAATTSRDAALLACRGLELGTGHHAPGVGTALSDGRRAPDHDFRGTQRERPHVLVQQARAQDHGAASWASRFTCTPFRQKNSTGMETRKDVILSYNLGGIRCMNESAFRKLEQEITSTCSRWKLFSGNWRRRTMPRVPPVHRDGARGSRYFQKDSGERKRRIPRIDPADFSVKGWTERSYYEVCTDPAIYSALERRKAAKG